MPVTPTYPGVYIEEVPSGVRTITGVSTSIAAFVDFFPRGPMNQAVQLFSFAEFEREFGGLDPRSEASYAIQQFFLNGGMQAWVVRTATGVPAVPGPPAVPANIPTRAAVLALDGVGGGAATALEIEAVSEGTWGNGLRGLVDYDTTDPATLFNLTVSEVESVGGRTVVRRQEVLRNLSMNAAGPRFAETIAQESSVLVRLDASGGTMPAPSGTLSATGATFPVAAPVGNPTILVRTTFSPNADGSSSETAVDVDLGAAPIATIDEAAARLQSAIRAAKPGSPAWSQTVVDVVAGRLQVIAGPAAPGGNFTFANVPAVAPLAADNSAQALRIRAGDGATINVAQYQLGAPLSGRGQGAATVGADGIPPNATDLVGTAAVDPPTGIFALDKADLFNILCLPRIARVSDSATPFSTGVGTAVAAATNYCEERRAFLVLDTPSNVDSLLELRGWLSSTLDPLRHRNVAVYFPRVRIADPRSDFRLRSFGASGTMAGVFARTDAERGVWKAPAGTDATLRGVAELDYVMTDAENGVINPLGINALRTFDVFGLIAWGARTLEGADQEASEWKYVPVRRLALFLEESLYRGTKWVVFEPNDEPLWAQIRLNVGAFMQDLFRQGAFQGTTPREAYFVKCDKETTTQNDINRGVVNILVGFAPLKPAEFVIVRIQQLAGQIAT